MSVTPSNNPWLQVSAASYDGHMGHPAVDQLAMLAAEFELALDRVCPASCAVLGCATGNGLDRLASRDMDRAVAVDINSDFVEIARRRWADSVPSLEFKTADVADPSAISGRFDFVWAGLVFEYVHGARVLANIRRWLAPSGVMTVVLQQLGNPDTHISRSPYQTELAPLESVMKLVHPDQFRTTARAAGFRENGALRERLCQGKRFLVGDFRAAGDVSPEAKNV
ncbi:MAG: class I SAM-dependent methyltransferase [Maricaulaceae bacterium]|jgi:SAM-dependent methyltransferase